MTRGAVLGSPVAHSLSPRLHKAAFEFLGIQGEYEAIDLDVNQLQDFFSTKGNDFDYFSLTMPLKEAVCTLDVNVHSLPALINSGNTLLKNGTSWDLMSTDGSGFLKALKHAQVIASDSTLILGAGGTARAIAQSLNGVSKNIDVLARSSSRREAIETIIDSSRCEFKSWNSDIDFADYSLIVNTTPAGAADLLSERITMREDATFFDVIYKPWPTVLARKWSDMGGQVINGLELLIYQGIDQLSLLLKQDLNYEEISQHLRKALAS
jgi:shikimate dehydrogenase